MRKIKRLLTSKFLLVCFLLLLELSIFPTGIILLYVYVPKASYFIGLIFSAINVILVLHVINSEMNADYKIAWLVPILLLPPFGCLLYVALRRRPSPRRKLKKLLSRFKGMNCLYTQDLSAFEKYRARSAFAEQCAKHLSAEGLMAASDCVECTYLPTGEAYRDKLCEELERAEKFIFLEYFIIQPGTFWDGVLEILKRKVKEGVDVRVIYDDIGSMFKVPDDYEQQLEKEGIACLCFNKFRAVLDIAQNNRTHRKIAVIDGEVAFTGGVNLADEYINETHPFGHWKDTGVYIRGRAAQNFTALFLQLWAIKCGDDDYDKFLSDSPAGDTLCIPFGDSPFDGDRNICEDLYLRIIYNAKKYVYINTPYLIPDGEMQRALITAARSGVDVRIAIPAVPDKRYVYAVTKAFSSQLVRKGIKVYRYKPGFLHAKSIVSDGEQCIIGTTNMDFRSFYLHYECNALFFDEKMSTALEKDFLETCEESELIRKEDIRTSLFSLLYRSVLRFFAPMM